MTLRVWLVSNLPPPVHGVSAFNAALLRHATRAGVDVRTVRVGTRGGIGGVQRPGFAKGIADALAIARLGSRLAARVRGRRRDVIYFTPSQAGGAIARDLALARGAAAVRVPLVAHLHGCAWIDAVRRGGPAARAMHHVLARCEAVICLGAAYARELGTYVDVPCVGIDNGVELAPASVPRAAPSATDQLELVHLSTLARAKGLFTAALALRRLVDGGVAARLRCAGAWYDARERAQFERAFAPELAVGTIELLGFVDEAHKRPLFDSAHFFVLPSSLAEGQPLSLIEAMARGVVPVATDVGGIPELLPPAARDRLCASRHHDARELARTISSLAADPAAFAAAARACLDRQRRDLTMTRCAASVLSVLAGGSP